MPFGSSATTGSSISQAAIDARECSLNPERSAAMQVNLMGRAATDVVSAAGDQATAFVIIGSIVIPLAILTTLCWFFWKHRHDD